MQPPYVSIILPIFDRTDILAEAIESALTQTYQYYELICILDGSPKETREVVYSYRYHPNMKIIEREKPSGNACRPRNQGILEAKGEWVAFLDSDDIMEPTRLAECVKYTNTCDFMYGDYYILKGKEKEPVQTEQSDLKTMLENGNPIGTGTVMVNRQWLLDVGLFKPKMRYMEDFELWCRLLHFGATMRQIPQFLTQYRIHKGNLEPTFIKKGADWKKNKWFTLLLAEYQKKNIKIEI